MNTYKKMIRAIGIPCMILEPVENRNFRIVEVSDSYLQATGRKRSDLQEKLASTAFSINPAQGALGVAVLAQSLYKVLETSKKDSISEVRFDLQKGPDSFSEHYWAVENSPILDDQGQLTSILCLFKDITKERLLREKERNLLQDLAIKEQEYRHFIEDNPDGLYTLDLFGNFTSANEGLLALAGVSLPEMLNKGFADFCHPEDQEYVASQFLLALKGESILFESRFINALGRELLLEINLIPTRLEGVVIGASGIAKDKTRLRQMEKASAEKSSFLQANAGFINYLFKNKKWDANALEEAFSIIGEGIKADRVYFLATYFQPETQEVYLKQQVEWASPGVTPQINSPLLQNVPACTLYQLMGQVTRNLPFSAVYSSLQESALKDIFREQDIQSMLVLPIFLKEELFGFIGFDDCQYERIWKEEEVHFLQTVIKNLTTSLEKRSAEKALKRKEKTLRRNEKKFRALVQEGSELISILDQEGTYKFVGGSSLRLLGMAPEEFIGRNASEFIHPHDVPLVQEQFASLASEKQVKLLPFRFQDKSGKWRWMETTVTNLIDDPAVLGIVSNAHDISRMYEQSQELHLLNERYSLAARATQDLIFDWDLVTDKIRRFYKDSDGFLGHPPAKVDRKEFWRKNIHPEDSPALHEQQKAILEDQAQNIIQDEYRFLRSDGSYAHLLDRAFLIRNAEGQAVRMVGATSDLSALKSREEDLQAVNKRFMLAMKATKEMIWDWDLTNNTIHRSKSAGRILGTQRSKSSVTTPDFWFSHLTESHRERVELSLRTAIEDPVKTRWRAEYNFLKPDGEILHLLDRASILRNEKGEAIRMVGATLDLTESRRDFEKIRQQNELLRNIAWDQSHLLRAPLARLQGLLNLLEEEPGDDFRTSEAWGYVKSSAEELDQIIRKIVDRAVEMEQL